MKNCTITVTPGTGEQTYEYIRAKARERFGVDTVFTRRDDPAVVGGFILQLDGCVYDLSFGAQLEEARSFLK